ncbi:MAG: hypothetical protein QF755_05275 [Candidatus Peribacteraceae bacterium]|jgi:hypothetical protein|nr:hypothetical protein [Candidatus Peribacteraceae bacterium]|tara:strand:+ start:1008 stop:1454 length:447 start_codon:yes stop_codon:yes gene_type:complete
MNKDPLPFTIEALERQKNSIYVPEFDKRVKATAPLTNKPRVVITTRGVCDESGEVIISNRKQAPLAICKSLLNLTEGQPENEWRIEVDTLYEEFQGKTEGAWLDLSKAEQQKFHKYLLNHIESINDLFNRVGAQNWVLKDGKAIIRLY